MKFTKNLQFSPDMEQAILGACIIEKQAFGRCYQLISPESFYYSAHQQVFQTMHEMYVNGIPIDLFTLTDQMMRVKNMQRILSYETPYFLCKLTNSVVSSANIEYHSFIIKSMWMEREIIRLTHGGEKLEGDVKQQIVQLQNKIQEIQQQSTQHDWSDMTKLMVELYRHQEEIKKHGGIGLPMGIKKLDINNGGMHPGQMIVIGARPSVGKSAFAGSIAMNVAALNKVVGIISLEMSNTEIAARLAAIDTETDFNVLYRGLYADEKQTHDVYKKISSSTSTLPIYVSDKTNVDITEIRSKADKLKSLHGLDLLIIDYLQLVNVAEIKGYTRENEIAKVSRYCKIMAKELNIPVILLCQLNRESTKRHGDARFPQLSDLRESGSIEQDADIVMFLHRDWLSGREMDENQNSTEFEADLVIAKWRNAASNFKVKLDFVPGRMEFKEQRNGFTPIQVDYQAPNPF